MTQEEKQILLADLCARLLPHCKIICKIGEYSDYVLSGIDLFNKSQPLIIELNEEHFPASLENVRPYLRPMFSITEEEKNEVVKLGVCYDCAFHNDIYDTGISMEEAFFVISWFLERHFDINHLIEKGLALEAPEGMYKI